MAQNYILARDCPGTLIPAGDKVVLPAGTEVFITQTLGGNVTVRTDQGLFRIAQENVAAIEGYTTKGEAPAESFQGEFSEQAGLDGVENVFRSGNSSVSSTISPSKKLRPAGTRSTRK